MRTIWKFDVPPGDAITIQMPAGARVLDVQMQGERARLWALVDPEAALELRRFVLTGTGHRLPDDADSLKHIGTFQLLGGSLVFHLFDAAECAG